MRISHQVYGVAAAIFSVTVQAQGMLQGIFFFVQNTDLSLGDELSLSLPFTDGLVSGTVNIDIGSPGTTYNLLFDPGSSNTWIGAKQAYVKTSTSEQTASDVAVTYGSGHFSGLEFMDLLELNGVSINQSIGVATSSAGISEDGLLGLGPTALTIGTLIPDANDAIPTVLDNLVSQNQVTGSIITINNDTIIFGTDPSPPTDVTYADFTEVPGASSYWGLDASFTYDTASLGPVAAGIVDHGSTLNLLPTSSYLTFMSATGAKQDGDTGLPMLASCDGLSPITMTLGSETINISVDQYRWPEANNTAIGGIATNCYLAVGDLGSEFDNLHNGVGPQFRPPSMAEGNGDAVKFILGFNTLKHFAVILDKDNSRIGFADL
jgi:cathepsin E